jgi:predicted RNA binding protein YcfA (HicA-like mRNA interferase family)
MGLKRYSSKEILQILKADGWYIKNQVGSHVQLVHPDKPGKVTVTHPVKDVPLGTVKMIFQQARLKSPDCP